MTDQTPLLAALNSGEVSPLALARVDLAKLKIACETQVNFLPHVLGPTMMRPGTQFIAEVPSDAAGWLGEFYFSETTKAVLVVTAAGMQFLVNDAYVTRVATGDSIANGNPFVVGLTSWTNSDQSGCTSSYVTGPIAGSPGPFMQLVGTGANYAQRDQQVTVSSPNVEHAVRVTVAFGTVLVQIGTSQGDGTYWNVALEPGVHSLAFTPTGNFWVRLAGNDAYGDLVQSIVIEGAGALSLPVPWAAADFGLIRYDQSADVIFVAAAKTTDNIGYPQQRIERRAMDSRSWGIGVYQADDGPFMLANQSQISITPSDVSGSIQLTASAPLFQPGHVNALFTLTQNGQAATATLAGSNQFTGTIRVTGLSNLNPGDPSVSSRVFAINISGTWVGTITLQRSLGAPGSWTDVKSWTANTSESFDDKLDNQIAYYQIGFKAGNYGSGSAVASLNYSNSVQTGVARVSFVTSSTVVNAAVITQFGQGAVATTNWAEGEWSTYRGFPAAVALHEGRLGWGEGIEADLSVSDAYASFDATVTGDAGPIDRTVATGGLDGIRWMLSLQRLIIGTATQEVSIRASALDEPLTPTAFVARPCATRGAAKVRPLRVDQQGIYVGRNGQRIYELSWNAQTAYFDYASRELTRLHQEIAASGIVDCAVQRQPDTRLWFVLGNGNCVVLTYDKTDDVEALTPVTTTNGIFERVISLPGTDEDDVYFIVNRTIGGVTKRFIEKLAKRDEAVGGTLSKTSDCHLVYSGAPTTTITGLSYLNGQTVVAWGDGAPVEVTAGTPFTATVSGGQITLPNAVSNAVVGLPYSAQLKTGKLSYGATKGDAVEDQKRVARVGLVMANVTPQGVRIGRSLSSLGGLPATYKGKALTTGQVLSSYDANPGSFNGGWDSDSRVCVQVTSPYCCTLMALALYMRTNEPQDEPQKQAQQ